jgi:hypothetical protein
VGFAIVTENCTQTRVLSFAYKVTKNIVVLRWTFQSMLVLEILIEITRAYSLKRSPLVESTDPFNICITTRPPMTPPHLQCSVQRVLRVRCRADDSYWRPTASFVVHYSVLD